MRILVPQLSRRVVSSGMILVGHHHHQAVGQGHQAAVLADEGDAEMIVGADDLVGEAEFADQFERGGFGGEEAVGAGFDGAAFDLLGLDDAAEARAGFDDGGGDAGFGQVVGRGEPGDSAADDDSRGQQHRFATSARAAVNVGEPFRTSGRRRVMPRAAA